MSSKASRPFANLQVLLPAIALLFTACHAVVGQRQASVEYKVERLAGPTELGLEQALNGWAKEGWVFEEVVMIDDVGGLKRHYVIFLSRGAR
jgi:hypothetical protein